MRIAQGYLFILFFYKGKDIDITNVDVDLVLN